MVQRLKLQKVLEDIMLDLHPQLLPDLKASNKFHVYFQPENNITLSYPAIVYELDQVNTKRANNELYDDTDRYRITVIDRNPDSLIPRRILQLRMTRFLARNKYDQLYHTSYTTYFKEK